MRLDSGSATGSAVDEQLTNLISTGSDLAVTEPVLMEVLAGARDDPAARRLRGMLMSFSWIPADPYADFEAATSIHRSCRAAGITPRGLIDCMIAAIAIRADAQLLAVDADFARMATVVPLRLR